MDRGVCAGAATGHVRGVQMHTHSSKLHGMDAVARLLDGTRARGAFALRNVMRAPWSLRILAESPLTLIAGVRGTVWIAPDEGEPLCVRPGDVAVTRAPDLYNVADDPETPPQVFIHPGQNCCDAEGKSVLEEMTHGVRTWGNDPDGETVFLVGAYEHLSDISTRLTEILPPVLLLSNDDWDSPLVPLLCDEVAKDEPGQAAVLDRLLDLLLTSVLKAWCARQDREQPAWWRSQGDPVVDRALRLIYADPARLWTVNALAEKTNASRASLARRFNDIVGEPPMTFLKNWRMAKAADLLCRPGETIATVAEQVGYRSPFAFSAAFKKARGLSPQEHRMQANEGLQH